MFTKSITFVIGAGAGVDIRMPLGKDLAEQISEALIVDDSDEFNPRVLNKIIARFINRNPEWKSPYLNAAATISNGIHYANSIDDFLESHLENVPLLKLGKMLIALKILEAEKNSLLYVDGNNELNTLSGPIISKSWFSVLGKLMFSGHTPAGLDDAFKNLSFVNFNYDRGLEQFLTHSIAARFNVPLSQSASLVADLKIFHPYGSLGEIGFPFTNGGLRFGGKDDDDINQISEKIFTYSEQTKLMANERANIHAAIAEAEIIVFLGFAFHEVNMQLLNSHNGIVAKKIIGTSIGMSNLDVEDVTASLKDLFNPIKILANIDPPQISLFPISCADLLAQHQRLLSD